MLFHVKALHYPDLNLTLLAFPSEQDLRHRDLLTGVRFEVDRSSQRVSTEHVAPAGNRYAKATGTCMFKLEVCPAPLDPCHLPKPSREALNRFLDEIPLLLTTDEPEAVKVLMKAYRTETLGGVADRTVALPLTVLQPYTVKGLRLGEAQRQRSDDAAAMASHRLIHEVKDLAPATLRKLQEMLLRAIERFNLNQAQPLLTQIDLGLWDSQSGLEETQNARGRHADAQAELEAAQSRVDIAWREYSRTYKRAVAHDLEQAYPGDSLLTHVLLNKINPFVPLRYL